MIKKKRKGGKNHNGDQVTWESKSLRCKMEQLSPRCVLFKFNGRGRAIQLRGSFEYEWGESEANGGE